MSKIKSHRFKLMFFLFLFLFLFLFSDFLFADNSNCYNNCGNNKIRIKNEREMTFPAVLSGYRQNIVAYLDSSNAAIFNISGIPYARIKVYVPDEFYIYANKNNNISVVDISYGGDLSSDGYAYFDRYGQLNNVRIGGTAIVNADDNEKKYKNHIKLKAYYE